MLLSLSLQPQVLRTQLAAAFLELSSLELCWQLGQKSDTPGTAFFIGYQAAMRCLDPSLPTDIWAAFAVSEKGVRNPYECQTLFDPEIGLLQGQKSHLMLASRGLDKAYVLAKLKNVTPVELILVEVDAAVLQTEPAVEQPFMVDVPHQAVSFSVRLADSVVFCKDAHQQANKPFRYWEDVHIALSLAGWLQAQLAIASKELERKALALIQAFKENPNTYSLHTLELVEEVINCAQKDSKVLIGTSARVWQRDSLLLKFSQPIRDKVRKSLLTAKG